MSVLYKHKLKKGVVTLVNELAKLEHSDDINYDYLKEPCWARVIAMKGTMYLCKYENNTKWFPKSKVKFI